MASQQHWDYSFDVVVVGSGNGGMTAALCTYEMGTKDILVIEKSNLYGGTSSISGGGVWIPCNRYARAAGADDSAAKAKTYLRQLITEEEVPEYQLDAYLENGPKMVDFLHQRTRMRYVTLEHYPDYYTNLDGAMHGHRSMEPETFNADELGEEWRRLRRTHPMMHLAGLIGFTQVEAALLIGQQPGWWKTAVKLVRDYVLDIRWRLKDKYHRRLATGCAGVARLRASMQDRDIPLWLNTAMTSVLDVDGKVLGIEVQREGRPVRIQARKAVVLAAGGFEHNQEMREQYLPQPTDHRWSAGSKDNTGDAIREGIRLGAKMPGVYEHWTFLRPLGDALAAAGHRVRVVHGLGVNRRSIAETSARLERTLAEMPPSAVGRVLVAHSKGGLIGKHLLVSTGAAAAAAVEAAAGGDPAEAAAGVPAEPGGPPLGVLGLVAVATPFGGARRARLFVDPSIRAFLPGDETIVMLGRETSVNGRVVSVFGPYDPHIPEGSALDGATNVTVPAPGHFRVLASRRTHAAVIEGVALLAAE